MSWLKEDPDSWILSPAFQGFQSFAAGLQVVNDTAERGVKLIQDFVNTTSNEETRKDLLLAISDHRKKHTVAKMTKNTLKSLS